MLELTWISNVDLTLCAQKEAYLFNTDEPSLLLFVVILDLHIHFYDKCSHLINLNLLVPYGTTLELVLGFIVTWIYWVTCINERLTRVKKFLLMDGCHMYGLLFPRCPYVALLNI